MADKDTEGKKKSTIVNSNEAVKKSIDKGAAKKFVLDPHGMIAA